MSERRTYPMCVYCHVSLAIDRTVRLWDHAPCPRCGAPVAASFYGRNTRADAAWPKTWAGWRGGRREESA